MKLNPSFDSIQGRNSFGTTRSMHLYSVITCCFIVTGEVRISCAGFKMPTKVQDIQRKQCSMQSSINGFNVISLKSVCLLFTQLSVFGKMHYIVGLTVMRLVM